MASIGKPFFDVRLFSGRFIGLSIPISWAQVEWLKHTTTRVPYSKSRPDRPFLMDPKNSCRCFAQDVFCLIVGRRHAINSPDCTGEGLR